MSDHTALDWRASIKKNFGEANDSSTDILVVASERSGCFPAAGPMWIVDAILETKADNTRGPNVRGVVVDFGGHWCYWEGAEKFNDLVLKFLAGQPTNA
jgi:pimeloyl-ACP methyl ester carboxylesterase